MYHRSEKSAGPFVVGLVLLLTVVDYTNGHVALTFPPARKYDLDFLDNIRTPAPCGMAKGMGPSTFLYSGRPFNVTWHLAYPHKGGYVLEILREDQNVSTAIRLTKPVGYETGDATRQHHTVTLPPGLVCNNCTMRLIRQAAEWAGPAVGYLFWSCADVDIAPTLPASAPERQCTSAENGQPGVNSCSCNRLFSGDRCQYKDVCWSDVDCRNGGKCLDIEATSFPEKYCFCPRNFFGETCERESSSLSDNVNLSRFVKTIFSQRFTMFHRIFQDTGEIEFFLRVKTKSWAGLGFRADGVTCNGMAGGRPEPEPETEPTGEPEVEPTGEPEVHVEPTGEPEVHVEPTGEPEVEPTGEPEGGGATHPMDCVDIVIGSARGDYGRVGDYFTRDRSTPRPDAVYGGAESLTAAMAYESGDDTVIRFRRRLAATESTDTSITDSSLHVIWAFGQASGKYVHRPAAGVDDTNPNENFYREDELKYHGHQSQRGFGNMNFFRQDGGDGLSGSWTGLIRESATQAFEYNAYWIFVPQNDEVKFTLEVKLGGEQRWIAIGFSEDRAMPSTDVVMGWMSGSNSGITDRFASSHSPPTVDAQSSIYGTTIRNVDGFTVLEFSRKRDTGDPINDFVFTDNNCANFFFALGGFDAVTGSIWKHTARPSVTDGPICIRVASASRSFTPSCLLLIMALLSFPLYSSLI